MSTSLASLPAPGAPARLLLVEDDFAIARFVALVLEDDAVDIVHGATLQEGLQALQSQRFDLVLTDLMLPDGNGIEVLLQAGQLSPRPRCFVFSAGVNAELRSRLHDAGAEKVIDKPIGVGPLRDALLSTPPATPAMAQGGDACERYFAGDRALYQAFQACARPQLRADLQTGDAALAAADLPALRRLGHSLKTALQMIDEPAVGELARALEASAKTGDEAAARRDWLRLRDALHRLHGDPV